MKRCFSGLGLAVVMGAVALCAGCRDNRFFDLVLGDSEQVDTSTNTTETNTDSKNDNSKDGAQ